MGQPATKYARSGDVRIAYQVVGNGPLDLVFVPGFISNLDVQWESPQFVRLIKRLSSFSRLIMFDKRGTGLSDRVDLDRLPSPDIRMNDLCAVMDAAGSTRAVLLGASEGGPMAMLFAAAYPKRTRALVLYGSYAHFYTWVLNREALDGFVRAIEKGWGTGATAACFAPDQDDSFRAWWARYERHSASPTAAVALARMNAEIDVRPLLASIKVPALIIHRRKDVRVAPAAGRYLAERIAGAQFIEIEGRDHPIWTGDVDAVVDEVEEFLTGTRPPPEHERILTTVMVVRVVDPARKAIELGDHVWSQRVRDLHEFAADTVRRYGGTMIVNNVQEVCARFEAPARAVYAAVAIRDAARRAGVNSAVGVHTGEVEIGEGIVSGLSLLVAQQLAATAKPDEIYASGVLAELAAGSGLHFEDRGNFCMDGMRSGLRQLAVMTEQHLEPAVKTAPRSQIEALTERERDVLGLVAEGLSNSAIAMRLTLSEHTVKRHVANILLKLDLPTRAAAAALVARSQLRAGL